MLPEKEAGKAEQSFRQKWLAQNDDSQNDSINYSINLLAQVYGAIFGLRRHNHCFLLSTTEEHYIASHIEQLVEMFSSSSVNFSMGIKSELFAHSSACRNYHDS